MTRKQNGAGDPIAAAIHKTDTAGPPEQHVQRTITIASTGRHFQFSLPIDVTEAELFEVVGWLASYYRTEQAALRAQREQQGGLTLPSPPAILVPR